MKPYLPASHSIPAWQVERAKRLHRACRSYQAAIQKGEKKRRAARRVARNYNGRTLHSDPTRRMRLSAVSLRRLYKVWKRGGEVPAALHIRYKPAGPSIPASVLVRFVDFCASKPLRSLKDAWMEFKRRGGSLGMGAPSYRRRLNVSYGQLHYNLPANSYYRIQSHLKAIEAAQIALAAARMEVIADIRRRVPDRPQRKPIQPEYQI
jgi:hypothetical protein